MQCQVCKTENEVDSRFCGGCGARVGTTIPPGTQSIAPRTVSLAPAVPAGPTSSPPAEPPSAPRQPVRPSGGASLGGTSGEGSELLTRPPRRTSTFVLLGASAAMVAAGIGLLVAGARASSEPAGAGEPSGVAPDPAPGLPGTPPGPTGGAPVPSSPGAVATGGTGAGASPDRATGGGVTGAGGAGASGGGAVPDRVVAGGAGASNGAGPTGGAGAGASGGGGGNPAGTGAGTATSPVGGSVDAAGSAPLNPYEEATGSGAGSGNAGPAVDAADDVDPGALSLADQLERQSSRSKARFDRCYTQTTKALPADQALAGDVEVAFQILPDGRVANAAVVHDTTGSTALGQCLLTVVTSWTFSSNATGALDFVRSFHFAAGR